jgi:hypothetical protein
MDIAIIPAICVGALIVWATYIRPAQERKKAEAARREQLRLIDQAERQARNVAAELRRTAAAERERIAAQDKQDRIEANRPHVDDLHQLLNARLELARATQALADREPDPYKRIQLTDKSARLYAQCNDINKKIDKLSR